MLVERSWGLTLVGVGDGASHKGNGMSAHAIDLDNAGRQPPVGIGLQKVLAIGVKRADS